RGSSPGDYRLQRLLPSTTTSTRRSGSSRRRGSELGDDAAHVDREERLLDHRAAARGGEVAQRGGKRISGHEDHALGALGPTLLDLLVQRAAVEVGHADIGEDHVVALAGEALQRLAPGARGDHAMARL